MAWIVMNHLLQQPIFSPGALVLALGLLDGLQRIRLRHPRWRATMAGFGLDRFVAKVMSNPGQWPRAVKLLRCGCRVCF